MEENKEEMSELAPSYNEDLGEDNPDAPINATRVVEDENLMDETVEKIKKIASQECPNVKLDGRHTYVDSGEIDKESLCKVWKCMCGKSILV